MMLIQSRVDADVAHVVLADPDRLNPLSESLQTQLLEALERLRSDSRVRLLVLSALGRGFCSGADLTAIAATRAEDQGGKTPGQWISDGMARTTNPIALALTTFPAPVLSVVQGPVAGAGVGLALAADVVLAAESAYFAMPFIPALGIIPDMGSSWLLGRAMGRARALGLMLLGDRFSARDAERCGLIWRACPDPALEQEAAELAARLVSVPRGAVEEARAVLRHAERASYAEQLEYERSRQEILIDRPAFAEGVRDFLKKRSPKPSA